MTMRAEYPIVQWFNTEITITDEDGNLPGDLENRELGDPRIPKEVGFHVAPTRLMWLSLVISRQRLREQEERMPNSYRSDPETSLQEIDDPFTKQFPKACGLLYKNRTIAQFPILDLGLPLPKLSAACFTV